MTRRAAVNIDTGLELSQLLSILADRAQIKTMYGVNKYLVCLSIMILSRTIQSIISRVKMPKIFTRRNEVIVCNQY